MKDWYVDWELMTILGLNKSKLKTEFSSKSYQLCMLYQTVVVVAAAADDSRYWKIPSSVKVRPYDE
jgi:hypothetical protein